MIERHSVAPFKVECIDSTGVSNIHSGTQYVITTVRIQSDEYNDFTARADVYFEISGVGYREERFELVPDA